jgi:hypothetical protein
VNDHFEGCSARDAALQARRVFQSPKHTPKSRPV